MRKPGIGRSNQRMTVMGGLTVSSPIDVYINGEHAGQIHEDRPCVCLAEWMGKIDPNDPPDDDPRRCEDWPGCFSAKNGPEGKSAGIVPVKDELR